MSRPGVDVISRALPPPRSAPTDTGVAFLIGATPTTTIPVPENVTLVRSLTEYENVFGDRDDDVNVGLTTYDSAETYFREGGALLYVSRTNGPAPARAAVPEPLDQAELKAMSQDELDALATERGLDPSGFSTKTSLINALTAALTAAPNAGVVSALAALVKDLGPGQVWIADAALAIVVDNQSALLAHCEANNRVALLSCADSDDATDLEAAGEALQTDANARYGALFAPSAVVPGVVAGTTRTVPYAAVQAGIIARNDVSFTANQPAAGELGQTVWALDVNGRYTDAEYTALNDASVCMARVIYGGVRTYGYRSCVDPVASPSWKWFGWSRLNMEITAQAEAIGERYVFSQIDGRGKTLAQFGGDLSAMLATFYEAGALFGETAQDAFAVDVGSAVNTPETIADGELHAVLKVKMSPGAEWVVIEIVKIATTEALAPPAVPVAA